MKAGRLQGGGRLCSVGEDAKEEVASGASCVLSESQPSESSQAGRSSPLYR